MKAKFVLLAVIATFTIFGSIAGSGQTVQPKPDVVQLIAFAPDPTADRVRGMTGRRLWATTAAVLGLIGVVIGGLALRRSANRNGTRKSSIVALLIGLIAVVNGGLNLFMATDGPGSGNGIIGGVAALALGLVAMALGWLAMRRSSRSS